MRQKMTLPDGPWTRQPDEIDENCALRTEGMRDDITIQERRERHKERLDKFRKKPKPERLEDILEIKCVLVPAEAVDMASVGQEDEEVVDLKVVRWFVNTPFYLQPGAAVPPSLRDLHHCDWSWNARGTYYRHYYSPEWVTEDHSLFVPTLDDINWNDSTEETRRVRARTFLKHAIDKGQWNRSEYAWEADAWTDVFGQMRDDPALAA